MLNPIFSLCPIWAYQGKRQSARQTSDECPQRAEGRWVGHPVVAGDPQKAAAALVLGLVGDLLLNQPVWVAGSLGARPLDSVPFQDSGAECVLSTHLGLCCNAEVCHCTQPLCYKPVSCGHRKEVPSQQGVPRPHVQTGIHPGNWVTLALGVCSFSGQHSG